MTPQRKRQIFNVVGICLSILFLYFCFYSLDREALKQVFFLPHPWLLLTVVGLNFLLMIVRAGIWSLLLTPIKPLPFWKLFDLLHIGYMANNLLPLKAGEFFRASFVAKRWNLPYTQVLTTIGLERYFPGFTLILILLVVSSFLPIPLWIKTGAYILGAILLGVQISLIMIWKRRPNLEKWKRRHPLIYRTIEFLFHVGEGSQPLREVKSFALLSLLGLLSWGIQAVMLWTLEAAFEAHVGFLGTLFAMVAINLAVSLPSAPGNLGTFELAAVLAYTWLGLDKPTALGIGFYFHFLQMIPTTILGLVYYFRWGLRLKELEAAVDRKAEAFP
jgi:uncharacterized protein (TIRG00374 family)